MDLSSSNVFDPFLKPFITFGLRNILWQWVPLFNYAFYEKVLPSVGLNLLVWQHQQVPSNSQEKQWTVGSYLLFSMSIRTWQTFTSCSYHPFPACRLLICLFFHRYRSCCPSLLIPNAFFFLPFLVQLSPSGVGWPEDTLPWGCGLIEQIPFANSFWTWQSPLLMDFK